MGETMSSDNTPVKKNSETVQVMLFRIGEQRYCLPVTSIREICQPSKLTPIPHAPSYVLGATNLRGEIPVIVNLSAILGVEPEKDNKRPVYIIMDYHDIVVGLLVDEVLGMASLQTGDISTTESSLFLKGPCIVEGNIVGVLDRDALIKAIRGEA